MSTKTQEPDGWVGVDGQFGPVVIDTDRNECIINAVEYYCGNDWDWGKQDRPLSQIEKEIVNANGMHIRPVKLQFLDEES